MRVRTGSVLLGLILAAVVSVHSLLAAEQSSETNRKIQIAYADLSRFLREGCKSLVRSRSRLPLLPTARSSRPKSSTEPVLTKAALDAIEAWNGRRHPVRAGTHRTLVSSELRTPGRRSGMCQLPPINRDSGMALRGYGGTLRHHEEAKLPAPIVPPHPGPMRMNRSDPGSMDSSS